MNRIFTLLAIFLMLLGVSSQANATLILRGTDTLGNQLIYDTDLDITWYDYSHWDPVDTNDWSYQVNWASNLTVDFGGTVYSDWRLTDADPSCMPAYCISSEIGHLYFTELGNGMGGGTASWNFIDGITGDREAFLNLTEYVYWTRTQDSIDPNKAWNFNFIFAYQESVSSIYPRNGLAVRAGDVAGTAVPEPATMLLVGSGFIGMAVLRKRFGWPRG